jgi:hypothetical protein
VDVAAADQRLVADDPEGLGDAPVARLVAVARLVRRGRRVAPGSEHPRADPGGRSNSRCAALAQLRARCRKVGTNGAPGLDHRRTQLVVEVVTGLLQYHLGILAQSARAGVDQQELLFDPQRRHVHAPLLPA